MITRRCFLYLAVRCAARVSGLTTVHWYDETEVFWLMFRGRPSAGCTGGPKQGLGNLSRSSSVCGRRWQFSFLYRQSAKRWLFVSQMSSRF
ncbi:hypothetical protein CSUI_011152 [Cystoisospora suis]|uniref:Secreted protein n=1 Tax=Cystoisospora suis TaxID=483139 RepID=A0A2C6KAJ0_9APIC|nr:hypothetical protein CSUI_011152 [Cystoisospora suis]